MEICEFLFCNKKIKLTLIRWWCTKKYDLFIYKVESNIGDRSIHQRVYIYIFVQDFSLAGWHFVLHDTLAALHGHFFVAQSPLQTQASTTGLFDLMP